MQTKLCGTLLVVRSAAAHEGNLYGCLQWFGRWAAQHMTEMSAVWYHAAIPTARSAPIINIVPTRIGVDLRDFHFCYPLRFALFLELENTRILEY